MVLKEITVKNFFSFAEEQTLSLTGNGLVNVNAPNGVGKTSLLIESLTFALFGKTRSEKIDDCINRYVGKDCKVSVTFEDDRGTVYKVLRYRKHTDKNNSVLVFKGDQNISCKNTKDTDALILDLFGMPYIAFINSTIFSSELYSNFLSAKNSERLVIFENLLSLKQITIFYTQIKEMLKKIEVEESNIKLEMTEKQTKINSFQELISSYSEQAKKRLLELKDKKETLQKEIKKAEEEIAELKILDIAKEKEKLSNTTLKKEYEKQILEKKNENNYLVISKLSTQELEILEKYSDFDFEENRQKEEKNKELSESLFSKENELKEVDFKIAKLENELSHKKNESVKAVDDLAKETEKMLLVQDSICPYCGKKMNEEETQKKREEIEKNIEGFNSIVTGSAKLVSEIEEKLGILKNIHNETSQNIANLKGEISSNNFIANTDLLEEKFKNAIERKKTIEAEAENVKNRKVILESEIKELEEKSAKIEVSKYTEEYLNSIEKQLIEQEQKISECKSKIDMIDGSVKSVYDKGYIEELKKKVTNAIKELEEVEEKYKEILNNKKHYAFLGECCSNKSGGFKKFFIDEMIPVFNEKINQYLPFFFNDMKIEIGFDKDLVDTIKVDNKNVSFASFSRGQKTRLEIAAAFALFNVSRIFFSNKSGLLIVDELLDNGLDEYGVKAAISILENFAQQSKIFVVSHNPVVKDNIDEVIEIKRDENGFSYIA